MKLNYSLNRKVSNPFKWSIFLAFMIAIGGCGEVDIVLDRGPIDQIELERVKQMPNIPQPLDVADWDKIALGFDSLMFRSDAGLMWWDSSGRNFDQVTFGMFTSLNDARQGVGVNVEAHEALGTLGALISASLMGIDKSNQDGHNYVRMIRNYFNKDRGWNIIMNFTSPAGHIGGGYGNDWWYDLYNNMLFYALGSLYPNEISLDPILRTVAEQVYKADSILSGNYTYSYFDFSTMTPATNHIVPQEDAAAAHAWILLSAYHRFGETKYLDQAIFALKSLSTYKENRFYEILMPFAAYCAARMNAQQGSDLPVQQFLDWTFNGDATNRIGWGVISDRWGGYDVHGMVGSTVHNGGYGFLMNTFDLAWPLTAMLKYDQRYALSVGKWILNAANTAGLFYPDRIPDSLQAIPHLKSMCHGVMAYEGLIKNSTFERFQGVTPFAQGDGPNWAPGMPDQTMFSVYGSAHVGFFGGLIQKTNVPGILLTDCNKTDFYSYAGDLPTYLIYNPYASVQEVTLPLSCQDKKIYDKISGTWLSTTGADKCTIQLAPNQSVVLVMVPNKAKIVKRDGRLLANDLVLDYLY
jgi:hypothetical protein